MRTDDQSERGLIVIGLLPLIAAACWLVLLREPSAVRAGPSLPDGAAPLVRDEHSGPVARRFLGVVVAGQEADLAAELGGRVVEVFAHAGDPVHQGDPLLKLASVAALGAHSMAAAQAAQDQSAERAAELAVETTRDKLQRMRRAPDAYSQQDIGTADLELRRSEAELAKMRAASSASRATRARDLAQAQTQLVRAPFDGLVASRYVDVGDVVGPGSPLGRVVDRSRFVRFAVTPEELPQLRLGSVLTVASRESARRWSATLVHVHPEIDAATGFGFARADLQGDALRIGPLLPGTRVDVLEEAGRRTGGRSR